jgi:transposase
MSKTIEKMTPNEIIQAIRAKDMRTIRALVIDGVVNKKIWTQTEVAEMVDVNVSTVNRWIHGGEQ